MKKPKAIILLVCICIAFIVTTIFVTLYLLEDPYLVDKQNVYKIEHDFNSLVDAINIYKKRNQKLPDDLHVLSSDNILPRIPSDPWGVFYRYEKKITNTRSIH